MIGVLAELERSPIGEPAGVKAALAPGRAIRTKAKLSVKQIDHTRKLIENRESRLHLAGILNVGRVTLYRGARGVTYYERHNRDCSDVLV
jgi:hypothetical protein